MLHFIYVLQILNILASKILFSILNSYSTFSRSSHHGCSTLQSRSDRHHPKGCSWLNLLQTVAVAFCIWITNKKWYWKLYNLLCDSAFKIILKRSQPLRVVDFRESCLNINGVGQKVNIIVSVFGWSRTIYGAIQISKAIIKGYQEY